MKINLVIHEKYTEPEIHVCADRDDGAVRKIYAAVKWAVDAKIVGYDDREAVMIPCREVIRIFSQDKKVYAQTKAKTYLLHERLYELEEMLDEELFIRISNSEMVNIHQIIRLDTGLTGTIRMYLLGDVETYVSRRYVTKIKKALGL